MSVYYDLYASGNPQKREEQQPLHARVKGMIRKYGGGKTVVYLKR